MKETLIERIKRHEGLRLRPYRDSLGNASIGYGHYLRIPINENAALTILRNDIANACLAAYNLPAAVISAGGITEGRKEVLIEMIFNLGFHGVLGFKRMLKAIEKEDFDLAAREMLDSLWALQVKDRARELADIMREG